MIITRILRDKDVTLSQLEAKAIERNVPLNDLYAALDKIHRDKRIQRKVLKGEIHYLPATIPKTPTDHLAWVNQWYKDNPQHCTEVPFPEIDYSHLFLKTKEERDAYLAEAKGMPVHMVSKKKYG